MGKNSVEEIRKDLVELLNSDYNKNDVPIELNDDTNIVTEFMLNSVDALELLLKIEEMYDVEIPDEKLNIDLLQNVKQLAEFIHQL